ncbi:MAG TPA: very short patch repair endonuclease [Solirubrobacterales bacterium]|nr:very short patch repair endonuclease [Solirubrobacterales bacterium]
MLGNKSESALEMELRSALHRKGLRFRKHTRPIESLRCRPDIVFPRQRLAVFVDGCFWHRCPIHGEMPRANREWWQAKFKATVVRDRRNNEFLTRHGWTVLRFWAHEPIEQMVAQVMETLVESTPRTE